MRKMLKKASVLLLVVLTLSLSGCRQWVEPGNVGIKVNAYGSGKGVEDYPIQTGAVWFNPFTETVYQYPTFTQNATWKETERISFNSSQGSKISCDVALSYSLKPEKVPHIFVKYRQPIDTITHNYLRNKVRDSINKFSSQYTAIEILGPKSQELIRQAREQLTADMAIEGFVIDTLSFISAPEPDDPNVKQSISQVIQSTQQAEQAENKVKQIEAEARQAVATAKGRAEAILEEAKAQAEANKIVAESLTPELVRYKMIETWDGKLPSVSGGDGMSFLVPLPEQARQEKAE